MKTSVLEFRIHDELFCLNTNKIEYVFELEEYNEVDSLDECVVGLVKYNDDVMFLIDSAVLYHNEPLDFKKPKSKRYKGG